MNNISQLQTRLIIAVYVGILPLALTPIRGAIEVIISILTLVLVVLLLLRENFGSDIRKWLMLALGTYAVGATVDLLDEIPELSNYWFFDSTDEIFMHAGVFLMCFCFIKILRQRRNFIEKLNSQITKARQLEGELSRQALQDDLTGVQNRRALFRSFDKMAINLQKGILAYIDLDNFKQVNDNWGHQYGDEVLINIATSLLKTAPTGSHVFRIGGDEFVVLLPNDDQEISQKWIDTLYNVTTQIREQFNIGISIGLAPYYPGNLSEPDSILVMADKAMYKEKRLSR